MVIQRFVLLERSLSFYAAFEKYFLLPEENRIESSSPKSSLASFMFAVCVSVISSKNLAGVNDGNALAVAEAIFVCL